MNENELNERVDVDVFDEFNVELLCFRLKNNFYVFEKFQEKKTNKQKRMSMMIQETKKLH